MLVKRVLSVFYWLVGLASGDVMTSAELGEAWNEPPAKTPLDRSHRRPFLRGAGIATLLSVGGLLVAPPEVTFLVVVGGAIACLILGAALLLSGEALRQPHLMGPGVLFMGLLAGFVLGFFFVLFAVSVR